LLRPHSRLALVIGGVLAAASCTSRTTPLPPPEVSMVTAPDGDGRVTVTGLALEGASIGVINNRTLEGVITSSSVTDCSSACPFEAKLIAEGGDSLRVWQFLDTNGLPDVPVPER